MGRGWSPCHDCEEDNHRGSAGRGRYPHVNCYFDYATILLEAAKSGHGQGDLMSVGEVRQGASGTEGGREGEKRR